MIKKGSLLFLLLAIFVSTPTFAISLTFQEGLNSHSDTDCTYIYSVWTRDDYNYGSETTAEVGEGDHTPKTL